MSTGFIFRFEGDKLLQPFLIPQSLFKPQLQGDPAAREMRRQQELEANHMLLENIEKARVSLDKAPEPGPLDAEFEKEPDFEPDEGTLLARLKRWGNKFFADKNPPEPMSEEPLEAEKPLSAPAEQPPRPAHVRRQRTGVIHRYELLERLLSMSPQEYIDYLREHQKNIWMEESYPLGMLVFAALDLPGRSWHRKRKHCWTQTGMPKCPSIRICLPPLTGGIMWHRLLRQHLPKGICTPWLRGWPTRKRHSTVRWQHSTIRCRMPCRITQPCRVC